MELSAQETSCASDLEDPAWWAASASPNHPRDNTGPSWDAAAGSPADKNTLEGWPDESWDPNMKFCSLEISASTKPSGDSFLEKLWEILSSQSFESIWWGNNGNCNVIGEKLFRKEVLGRRGPRKIFETESMRGFLLQLMFRRMEGDSPLLTSTEELRAVAAAGSVLGKVHQPLPTQRFLGTLGGGSGSDKMSLDKAGDRMGVNSLVLSWHHLFWTR
ncbi:HSFX1 protein, partial [Machaerirhynchus nigripectus]|nr:HSFX1 protein [Machaerirhynchus nigripectus]